MQKDKHNIYSKDELLKLIKEGKNAPADMDEFELEALEGLKLLDKPDVLNELNKEVDEIVIAEKKKENQRKTIYYFSAAASLLFIVGLIFLFKNEVVVKNEKVVAELEKPKEENLQQDLKSPVQEETPITYEAKEPEQAKAPKKEITVLAESKAKQKTGSKNNLEQETIVSANNEDAFITKDGDGARKEQDQVGGSKNQPTPLGADAQKSKTIEKEQFQHSTDKTVNGVLSMAAGVIVQDKKVAANQNFGAAVGESNVNGSIQKQDQDKSDDVNKSKKVVASMSQPAMAYQSKDEARTTDASPGAPHIDSKKAEEKTKSDLFYANKSAKNKEATFIGGDSTFKAYVKQNLKISSPNNSGIIVVTFLINKDGTTSNIEIIKSLSGCEICSKDVIDFVKSIKKWQPAVENGKAISAPKKISIQYN